MKMKSAQLRQQGELSLPTAATWFETYAHLEFAADWSQDGKRGTERVQTLLGFAQVWWAQRDLNPRPSDYESPALTAELWAHETVEPVQIDNMRLISLSARLR